MVDRDKQYPLMIVLLLQLEKERSGTAFSSLGGWRSERKNSDVILSHPTNSRYTFTKKNLAQFYSGQK